MLSRITRDRFLSDAELEAFMAAVRDRRHVNQPRDHALFALLANTGIRPSEALALTRADLHLRGPAPWISVTRKKKRAASPVVDDLQIPLELANIVSAHADACDVGRVFTITRRTLQRLFHWYARRAGIAHRYLYCLRHTAATRIYRATHDVDLVRAVLGHESATMTSLYVHVSRAMVREAVNAVPSIV